MLRESGSSERVIYSLLVCLTGNGISQPSYLCGELHMGNVNSPDGELTTPGPREGSLVPGKKYSILRDCPHRALQGKN